MNITNFMGFLLNPPIVFAICSVPPDRIFPNFTPSVLATALP